MVDFVESLSPYTVFPISWSFAVRLVRSFQLKTSFLWRSPCRPYRRSVEWCPVFAPLHPPTTTTDWVSVNDVHWKAPVLRRRCSAEQVKEKHSAGEPKLTHLLWSDLPPTSSAWSLSCPTPDLQATGNMGNMATEIVAFLLTMSGWILVSSTLPTDYWKVSSVDGTVITTATFWSNLWKTCVTDSTGVSNCKDFPSMLALDGEVWRWLLLSG